MHAIRAFAALSAICLSGCAALHSTRIDYANVSAAGPGLQYALPKGVFRVELIQHGDDIHVAISRPEFVGDMNASYMLQQSGGLLADQEYLLVADPETRLLAYVNSASEGRAGQILQNLARSAVAVGNASDEGSRGRRGQVTRTIYSRVVDPFALEGCSFGRACNFASINAELRSVALDWFDCAAADGGEAPDLCARLRAHTDFFQLSLSPLFATGSARQAEDSTIEACRRSICYRAPAPYAFGLRVNGVVDLSEIVLLPNDAPVMAMNVPAGVFAQARARIDLYDGMPARYAVDQQNELVAVTLVPFNVVKEGFSALGEVFRFRVDYNSARANDLRSQRALDAARAEGRAEASGGALSGAAVGASDMVGDAPSAAGSFSADEGSRDTPMEDDTGLTNAAGAANLNAAAQPSSLFDVSLKQEDEPAPADSADIAPANQQ